MQFGPDSTSLFESVIDVVGNGVELNNILGVAKNICGSPVVRIRDIADEDGELKNRINVVNFAEEDYQSLVSVGNGLFLPFLCPDQLG